MKKIPLRNISRILFILPLMLLISSQAFSDGPSNNIQPEKPKSLLERLIDTYEESSKTDETLKHLLDAKMYLSTAEHDLLVSHDKQSAQNDIEKSLTYLLEAENSAKPEIKSRVIELSKTLKELEKKTASKKESGQSSDVNQLLGIAQGNLSKAKENASAPVKIQIEALALRIQQIRQQIEHDNLRVDYESAMTTLGKIINSLH